MSINLTELLTEGVKKNASDIHVSVKLPPIFRINGALTKSDYPECSFQDTEELVMGILSDHQKQILEQTGQVDLSYSVPEVGRYRVNAYKQRNAYGMALRIIPTDVPTIDGLGNPQVLKELSMLPRGLILVTGPTGSGKSTTLATMVDHINTHVSRHILTLEDPIEYLHRHKLSMINQREIGADSDEFANGLRAALRQDPDVILVGEMRDLETIATALTAAETGHLVLSTLHTIGAAKTIDRVIDVFPPHQQQQVRVQFASVIEAVISQQLLPRADGNGRACAFEIMTGTPAIRNMIREGKTHQIETVIQTGAQNHMVTMDSYLLMLYRRGAISKQMLLQQAVHREQVQRQVENVFM